MTPFAGEWIFDLDKTLVSLKKAGATDEHLAQLRTSYTGNPPRRNMHSDITFDGNVAVGAGPVSSEYRFFGMHKHGSKICGKAWHHEDRYDPGDMSKCHVRLEIVDGDLSIEVKMQEGLPDSNDPDLSSLPLVEGDVAKCDVDTKGDRMRGNWMTYVFSRRH